MQPRSKTKLWENEGVQLGSADAPVVQPVEDAVVVPEEESDDEYQVITKKPKDSKQKQSEETHTMANASAEEPDNKEKSTEGVDIELSDAPPGDQGPVSDADWLRSRTSRVLDFVEDDEEAPTRSKIPQENTGSGDAIEPAEEQPEASKSSDEELDVAPTEKDKIRQTGRLFLRNLHYDVTEDELRAHFEKSGALEEVRLIMFSFLITFAMMNIHR